jgi:formylglycine-generating enzyme required for sulfatase activity
MAALQADPDVDSMFCPACGTVVSGHDTVAEGSVSPSTPTTPAVAATEPLFELPGFVVHSEIGRGGMGVVYRARQLRPNRDVAIKVLPPALAANSAALERFRNEADAAALLVNSHVLPVLEMRESHGVPMLVLPYIDGTDLRRAVAEQRAQRKPGTRPSRRTSPIPNDPSYLERMLALLDQLVDAVSVIHTAGVLHRDIKPSNVLVDRHDNLWLGDFGLARLGNGSHITASGSAVGTPGYMSPEQASGRDDVDERADLFSLAVTIYEALTLELPYGKNGAKENGAPPVPPSRRQRLLSKDFDVVLLKAMEIDRAHRYASVAEFRDDWRRLRQGLLPVARRAGLLKRTARAVGRSPWRAAAALLLVVCGALGVAASMPHPVTQTVRITTEPPGARIAFVPLDEDPFDDTDGYPIPERAIRTPQGRTTPLELSGVAPGTYLVVAELAGRGFQEVLRTVPPLGQEPPAQVEFAHLRWKQDVSGVIELPAIVVPAASVTDGMARFDGGEFVMGSERLWQHQRAFPPHLRSVPAFFLDCTEVTVAEVKEHWASLLARTSLSAVPDDDARTTPVNKLDWDHAVAFAERIGKRLPNEVEYEFAATAGGTRDYPWGDDARLDEPWTYGSVKTPAWDHTQTNPPVYGLYSNLAEWTSSWFTRYPGQSRRNPPWREGKAVRAVRGGTTGVVWRDVARLELDKQSATLGFWSPRYRPGFYRHDSHPGLGFRCARSVKPPFLD